MKRRTFLQNKLWRDKVVPWLEDSGSIIEWKKLDDVEFDKALRSKLQEETEEVIAASSQKELTHELADVLEVMITLGNLYHISLSDMIKAQEKKKQERGGFEERKFVIKASHIIGSFGELYFLKDPQKHPEIPE